VRSSRQPLTRKSFPSGLTITLDPFNANPDNQVTVAIADPVVSSGSLSVSRTGNLDVTMSGVLSITAQGPMQPWTLWQQSNVGATPAGQPIAFSYNYPALPAPVSYSGVTATWNDLHVTAPPNFTTTGPYQFTQYNSIAEQSCSAAQGAAFLFAGDGTCAWTLLTGQNGLKGDFITQVTLNGTGISTNPAVGLIAAFRATELYTYNQCAFPPGSNQDPRTGNVFVQIPTVQGSCNQQLNSGSLATNPNPALASAGTGVWNCADQVALLNNASNSNLLGTVLPVQDWCPACVSFPAGTDGHIDVFSTTQACSKVGNYSANPIQGVRLR